MLQQFEQNFQLLKKGDRNAIDAICKLTIEGDTRENELLDQFLEKDVLNELLNILRTTKDHLVTNCILESVSMLVYFYLFINICRINIKKCITYVLKSMNDFIIHPYNFEQEDTQDYYINFMKVLSQKLDVDNYHLFFNFKYNYFPLLLYSQQFQNQRDNMLQVTAQNIMLQILKVVKGKYIEQYLSQYPFVQVYVNQMIYVKNLWMDFINSSDQSLLDNLQDHYMFLRDLVDTCPYLENTVENCFINVALIPGLQHPLVNSYNSNFFILLLHMLQHKFTQNIELYVLRLLFGSKIVQGIVIYKYSMQIVKKSEELEDICSRIFNNTLQEEKPNFMYNLNLFKDQKLYIKEFLLYDICKKLSTKILFEENLPYIDEEWESNYYRAHLFKELLTFTKETAESFIQFLIEIQTFRTAQYFGLSKQVCLDQTKQEIQILMLEVLQNIYKTDLQNDDQLWVYMCIIDYLYAIHDKTTRLMLLNHQKNSIRLINEELTQNTDIFKNIVQLIYICEKDRTNIRREELFLIINQNKYDRKVIKDLLKIWLVENKIKFQFLNPTQTLDVDFKVTDDEQIEFKGLDIIFRSKDLEVTYKIQKISENIIAQWKLAGQLAQAFQSKDISQEYQRRLDLCEECEINSIQKFLMALSSDFI